MKQMLLTAGFVLTITAVAGAVDMNRLNPGSAPLVEEFGSRAPLMKTVVGDKSKEKELMKFVTGENSKAGELVKNVTGDKAKEKELLSTVPSGKEKERLLVKEIVPLETTVFVTPSRSRLYHSKLPIERFSISNPQLMEIIQYSPFEFELLGRNPGACSVTIWLADDNGFEQILRLGVRVGRDDGRD